jgi:hypothetical protein
MARIMATSEKFEGDAFISYAHLDNIELVEGRKGWVANLYRALDVRLAQLLGSDARVWWDPKLQGNDDFPLALAGKLDRCAALVAVVSPRYVKSEWTLRELQVFCAAAQQHGGLRIGDKARVFKVLKTPVPLDEHPAELQSLLGYEFFKIDPESGKVRELDEIFGPDAQREFWLKLDDLAHDLAATLQLLYQESESAADATPHRADSAIYLATTTGELREEREAIKRELEQHGHVVLPNKPLPLTADEIEAAVRTDLARCRMSIHMVGKTYGLVPEGGRESLLEIQYELAVERAASEGFSQVVWIPPGLEVTDERQRRVLESLRMDPRVHKGADLLETPLEDLRTVVNAWLKDDATQKTSSTKRAATPALPHLYLIYDQRDAASINPWADFLFTHFEVIHPVFEGDEAEIRAYHEENLRTCDGALLFYGAANEVWLRRKLRELQKSAGYGRVGRTPVIGVCLIGPRTPEKERFRTHEAMLIEQWDGLSPAGLQPFITLLTREATVDGGDGNHAVG